MNDNNRPRWKVCIYYRCEGGRFQEKWCEVEEFEDVASFIETGHAWDTIAHIAVTRINPVHPGLTVEAAAEL